MRCVGSHLAQPRTSRAWPPAGGHPVRAGPPCGAASPVRSTCRRDGLCAGFRPRPEGCVTARILRCPGKWFPRKGRAGGRASGRWEGRWLGFGPCLRILARAMVPASSPAAPASPLRRARPVRGARARSPSRPPGGWWGCCSWRRCCPGWGCSSSTRTSTGTRWCARSWRSGGSPRRTSSPRTRMGRTSSAPCTCTWWARCCRCSSASVAGRAVSLVFGVLSVVPLFALTRRLFGWRAGVAAGLAFSVVGHAPAVLHHGGQRGGVAVLHAGGVRAGGGRRGGEPLPAAVRARRCCSTWRARCATTRGCTSRSSRWPLVFSSEDRVASLTRAVGFGLVCLPFPLLWMQGNELAHGDPLFPIKAMDDFHRQWVADSGGCGRRAGLAAAAAGVLARRWRSSR